MHNLGVMIADGGGGKPDYAGAAEWFRKAAMFGVRDSQFNLAVLYARGMGVPQDLKQSYLYFTLAVQQGDTDAGKKRDEVAARMDAKAMADATALVAAFRSATPTPLANEVAAPPGGWDAKAGQPQAGAAKAGATL
jgi:localization factor PodJL